MTAAGSWKGRPGRGAGSHQPRRARDQAELRNASLPVQSAARRFRPAPLFAFVALIPVEEACATGHPQSRRGRRLRAAARGPARRPADRSGDAAATASADRPYFDAVGPQPQCRLGELSTLVQLFAIAVLVADVIVHDPSLVRPLLWTYSISASFTAAIGILNFVEGNRVNERVAALPGQDPAHFAALLLPAFLFCTFELLRGRRPYLSLLVTLLTLGGIVLSGTRGAWVSILAVLAVFVFPALELSRKIAAVVLLLLLVFGAVLQIPDASNLIMDRVATAGESGGAGRTDV